MQNLIIGNLKISPPILQGGMGVRVSRATLASAVANAGCAGIIACAGLGLTDDFSGNMAKANAEALRYELRKARRLTKGVIGVNIMVALNDYESLVTVAVEEGVDFIVSGAGLPLDLPKYLNGKDIKLIPVVSSVRTFNILCKRWKHHFNKLPDAVIVEGPMAGGHLGYAHQDVENGTAPALEEILSETVLAANAHSPAIPVIAAGGIWDGKDIARVLRLGASGVQMATRFVCTEECEVHDNFKQAYLNARAEDIRIIKSPVGMPGRVINNRFVETIMEGKTVPFKCTYRCLKSCEPQKAPYCIAQVLADASRGKMDQAFAFAGSNAHKCTEIVPVAQLIRQLAAELDDAMGR